MFVGVVNRSPIILLITCRYVYSNCYYGEQWAGLMHRELTQWLENHRTQPTAGPELPAPGENCIPVRPPQHSFVSNISEIVHEHTCPAVQDNACPDDQDDDTQTNEDTTNEQGSPHEQSANEQGCTHITWESLESLRRRFTYDIMPKVGIILLRA